MRRFRPTRRRLAGPVLAAVMLAAACVEAAGAADWVDAKRAGPFICRADFPLAEQKGLLAELAQLQIDLVRYLGIRPAEEPIHLYLFQSEKTYRAFLNQHFPQVPYRRALYLKQNGPGMVLAFRSREFETDVRHECTHALLHAALPMVPLWLDEGLAEYFEVPAGSRAFNNPHLNRLKWGLLFGGPVQLEELEKKGSIEDLGDAEYRAAWSWVHFLLHGSRAGHAELVAFLRDIQARTPPGRLSARLARRLPRADQRLAAHFRSWKR